MLLRETMPIISSYSTVERNFGDCRPLVAMLWSCWERLSERSSGEFQAVVLLEKTVLELYIERKTIWVQRDQGATMLDLGSRNNPGDLRLWRC